MGISKMCLKQLFFHFKWALQAILFLTVELCVGENTVLASRPSLRPGRNVYGSPKEDTVL